MRTSRRIEETKKAVIENDSEVLTEERTQEKTEDEEMKTACPKCGKKFLPAGLAGHLRFVHGVGYHAKDEVRNIVQRKREIFDLSTNLEEVRVKLQEWEKRAKEGSTLFSEDKTANTMVEELKHLEQSLLDEMKALRKTK